MIGMRYRLCALVCALLVAVAAPVQGQTIDGDRLLAHVEELASDAYAGRAAGTEGNAKARAYLLAAFGEIGIQPFGDTYERPFTFVNRRTEAEMEGINVVGFLPGTENPDAYLVLTAHFDHLPIRDGQVYNGADDNASGTSALLEIARAIKANPTKHSVLFVAFDAEELGLQGARYFVADPPVAQEQLWMNVNMDMVSRNPKDELYAVGTYHYPYLKTYLDPVVADASISLLYGHDSPEWSGSDNWTNSSDHAPFHQNDIPFIYFGVEDHPGYHNPSDDFDAITPEFFVKAAHTILQSVYAFDANLAAIHEAANKQ